MHLAASRPSPCVPALGGARFSRCLWVGILLAGTCAIAAAQPIPRDAQKGAVGGVISLPDAIIVYAGAAGTIGVGDVEAARDTIAQSSVFVTQLEQPVEAARHALEIARGAGVTTIFNPAPAEAFPEEGMLTSDEHPDGEPTSAAEQSAWFPDHARVGLDHGGCSHPFSRGSTATALLSGGLDLDLAAADVDYEDLHGGPFRSVWPAPQPN